MNQKSGRNSSIEIVFPVVLFLVFTLSALFIILFAARTYQHIVKESAEQYDSSTSAAYLVQKIHAGDSMYNISLCNIEGTDGIRLHQYIEDQPFVTYIYVYDGYLRELFTGEDNDTVSLSAGTPLFAARGFSASYIKDGLLTITVDLPEGDSVTQLVSIRSMR